MNGFEFVKINNNPFLYGDDNRTVILDNSFMMMKYPVTVSQYRAFCSITGRNMPMQPNWGWIDEHPIVNVSWYDANDFAEWLELALPTTEEWELASRGIYGRLYPWGNEWDFSRCCNSVNGQIKSTIKIGSYPSGVSPYGVHDMAGNVWEWTCSNNRINEDYIVHGGSWFNFHENNFHNTFVNYRSPENFYNNVGIRCILRLPGISNA
jgi:serine/threonine-protein kinase